MREWQKLVVGGVFVFALGIATGHFLLPSGFFPSLSGSTDANEADSRYQFINPLLFCKDQDISNFTNAFTADLEKKLRDYISSKESSGDLAEASVYYKDLNEGPWVLIHNSMKTVPASLLKVPTALAIYKHAEADPTFLNKTQTLTAANTVNATQYFKPAKMIEEGKTYTNENLVEYLLQDSDNAALFMLGQALPEQDFKDSYEDLGIPVPEEVAPGYTIDVKTYASFFRVLYNASYLNQPNSEHLLSLLSNSDFTKGIRAGVPAGTTVADKFGEFRVSDSDYRLNDCGIVYKPHDPYILCILTRGSDYDTLAGTIASISTTVWSALDAHN